MKKNFYNDVKAAEESEGIVVNLLLQSGYYVEDVRHLKNYQVRSIDYVALGNQQVFTIEVKDDQRGHATGNFIIELEAGGGRPGWFRKCQATTLAIVSKAERLIFLLSMTELKQFISMYENQLQCVTIRDYNTNNTYESFRCLLIPRDFYQQYYSITKICF